MPATRSRDRVRALGGPRAVAMGIEAAVLLMGYGIGVRTLSFRRLTRRLGVPSPPGAAVVPTRADVADDVRHAVGRAAVVLPGRARCLSRTLAAQHMLRRRGVACVTHFGARVDGAMSSHAWIAVGDLIVAGDRNERSYEPVLSFVYEPTP